MFHAVKPQSAASAQSYLELAAADVPLAAVAAVAEMILNLLHHFKWTGKGFQWLVSLESHLPNPFFKKESHIMRHS